YFSHPVLHLYLLSFPTRRSSDLMSFVYLAREVSTGHDVAIKVLSPKLATDRSSVERLQREAGLAMRLDHPNVCRILRLGESEDGDRKSTRLNSSHGSISYAVFCL